MPGSSATAARTERETMDHDTPSTKDKTMPNKDKSYDHRDYPDDHEMYRREAELRANPPTYSLAETIGCLPEAEDRLNKAKTHLAQVDVEILAGTRPQSDRDAAKKSHMDASTRVHGLRSRITALASVDSAGERSSIPID